MAKKTIDWMKTVCEQMLAQFDAFTTKLNTYKVLLGLTDAQVTASRNDYLWAAYACQQVSQFDQELSNRVEWRDKLLDGPTESTAQPVPSVGSEFAPPAPPAVLDGVLPRWRKLVEQIKASPNYVPSIGEDLGIEATGTPAQSMKPRVRSVSQTGGKVILNVLRDDHDSIAVRCIRPSEPQGVLVGVFTRSLIEDTRPVATPGVPEQRQYTMQYFDKDQPVGDVSDPFIVIKQP